DQQGCARRARQPQVRGRSQHGGARRPLLRLAVARQGPSVTPSPRSGGTVSLYKRLQEVQGPSVAPTPTGRRDPVLDELRQKVHHHLIEELGPVLYDKRLTEDELR